MPALTDTLNARQDDRDNTEPLRVFSSGDRLKVSIRIERCCSCRAGGQRGRGQVDVIKAGELSISRMECRKRWSVETERQSEAEDEREEGEKISGLRSLDQFRFPVFAQVRVKSPLAPLQVLPRKSSAVR